MLKNMTIRGHVTQADPSTQSQSLSVAVHGIWEYVFRCGK